MPDLALIAAAARELDDNLGQAIDILAEPDRLSLTPAQAASADRLVDGYVRLAGIALESLEEAARG